MQVSILYAFIAGIISFLSPCVLPLVPGYVSLISGATVEDLVRTGHLSRRQALVLEEAVLTRTGPEGQWR